MASTYPMQNHNEFVTPNLIQYPYDQVLMPLQTGVYPCEMEGTCPPKELMMMQGAMPASSKTVGCGPNGCYKPGNDAGNLIPPPSFPSIENTTVGCGFSNCGIPQQHFLDQGIASMYGGKPLSYYTETHQTGWPLTSPQYATLADPSGGDAAKSPMSLVGAFGDADALNAVKLSQQQSMSMNNTQVNMDYRTQYPDGAYRDGKFYDVNPRPYQTEAAYAPEPGYDYRYYEDDSYVPYMASGPPANGNFAARKWTMPDAYSGRYRAGNDKAPSDFEGWYRYMGNNSRRYPLAHLPVLDTNLAQMKPRNKHILIGVLVTVGAVAAVGGVAYAVHRGKQKKTAGLV